MTQSNFQPKYPDTVRLGAAPFEAVDNAWAVLRLGGSYEL